MTFANTEQQMFQSIDEIKPGSYYRSRSRTVDALCLSADELFQMTVSISGKRAKDIRCQLQKLHYIGKLASPPFMLIRKVLTIIYAPPESGPRASDINFAILLS